jgi:hypothetical protein
MNRHVRRFIIIFAMSLITVAAAAAQGVHTPDKDSAERKTILDALRLPIDRDLKQKIVFVVENLNVSGNWAFVGGSPQLANGAEPNYRGTKYSEAKRAGMFDNNYFALLRRTAGKWSVVAYRIGCTDVCYATWWRDHRAPKGIFPYTE